jgi:hypothetical protein
MGFLILSRRINNSDNTALLEKIVAQLLKIFSTLYGARKFITMFTTAHLWFQS